MGVSRRKLLSVAGIGAVGVAAAACDRFDKATGGATPPVEHEASATAAPAHTEVAAEKPFRVEEITNPDQALKLLKEGNARYVSGQSVHPDQTSSRRTEVAKAQHPFANILSCADSRVGPEVLFDQGLGDLFVNRVAGNVFDDEVLGSIEYAAEHLEVPLLVVLGHERCGAVKAAVGFEADGKKVGGHIDSLVEAILPAVEKVKGESGDPVENVVRENVRLQVESLKESEPILAHLIEEGKLKIVGARYDLDDGKVEWLD